MSRKSAPSYFVDHKKGEVNELKMLLRQVAMGKDTKTKRDIIQKVIAYMTLGIDVSRLFSEMVLVSNTKSLVVKKMVFLYLCNYAATNPELTLLAINTLQKDCRNEDPMVRGLALRSLTSLRLDSILEYVMTPLKNSLTDTSAYVRKTGVMGILKVFHLAPSRVKDDDNDMLDIMYNMLRDRDPQVVVNCIVALNEIMADEGGIAINQAIVHHLINKIRDFNEWGQCVVLELVARYRPAVKKETFVIMNLLDGCLRVSNSAVVLATCKAFLNLTEELPEIQTQVYMRMKTPLLTLMAAASWEVEYVVLQHVAVLVDRAPGVFDAEFKQFFLKHNEPTSVRHIKLDIMPQLANDGNVGEIVAELSEYVSDVNADMARHAIRGIASVVVRYPAGADRVIECLLELSELEVDYVRAETVVVMRDLLRKYPNRAKEVLPSLGACLKRVEEPHAKAAVIWMIGHFGEFIAKAPYMLEPLIDGVTAGTETAVSVCLELLTATTKLLFKRGPEVQHMLGRLLKACLEDVTSASVHDRALMYFRLLRSSIGDAKAVIASLGAAGAESKFLEEQDSDLKKKIFEEFNTLGVVYGEPSEHFISSDYQIKPSVYRTPGGDAAAANGGAQNGTAAGAGGAGGGAGAGAGAGGVMGDMFSDTGSAAPAPAPAVAAPAPAAGGGGGFGDDLLGLGGAPAPAPAPASAPAPVSAGGLLDDLFGDSTPAPAPVAPPAPAVGISLAAGPKIAPQDFQSKWLALGASPAVTAQLVRMPTCPDVEARMAKANIGTMAAGPQGTGLRFFFFAQEATSGAFHLVEATVNGQSGQFVATIKSENASLASPFAQHLITALGDLRKA